MIQCCRITISCLSVFPLFLFFQLSARTDWHKISFGPGPMFSAYFPSNCDSIEGKFEIQSSFSRRYGNKGFTRGGVSFQRKSQHSFGALFKASGTKYYKEQFCQLHYGMQLFSKHRIGVALGRSYVRIWHPSREVNREGASLVTASWSYNNGVDSRLDFAGSIVKGKRYEERKYQGELRASYQKMIQKGLIFMLALSCEQDLQYQMLTGLRAQLPYGQSISFYLAMGEEPLRLAYLIKKESVAILVHSWYHNYLGLSCLGGVSVFL